MKERVIIPEKTIKLSCKERKLAKTLFFEGLRYDELKQNTIVVGSHLSFMLHHEGHAISLHFREGLEGLKKYKDEPIKMMKKFLGNIQDDLGQLASMLKEDPRLISVKEVWGLCNLSARWGERHGFITKVWSKNPKKIAVFEQSITGKPQVANFEISQPLYLFFHNKDTFRSEFSK